MTGSSTMLLRSDRWMPIWRIVDHWAAELDVDRIELGCRIVEDAASGMFDDLPQGWGIRFNDGLVGFDKKIEDEPDQTSEEESEERLPPTQEWRNLLRIGSAQENYNFLHDSVVNSRHFFSREAVLRFAAERRLPPPSWWALNEPAEPESPAEAAAASSASNLPLKSRIIDAYFADFGGDADPAQLRPHGALAKWCGDHAGRMGVATATVGRYVRDHRAALRQSG